MFLSFNKSLQQCEMAVLDFLEDPIETETPKDILVDLSVIEEIPMHCRGGEHCCYKGHANQCGEGEGDCNTDNDCEGALVCGHNNCLETRIAGGLYDDQDDCCERACTPEHPCKHGEGTCSTDNDCLGQAVVCGFGNCMNEQTFPRANFPNNYFAEHFNSTDKCCVQLCGPTFKCDINEFGCSSDDECQDGLFCDKIDNICKDIDECNITNGKSNKIYECGLNAYCTNTDKSFTCSCNVGYTNFIKYEGCSDINECSTTSCGSRAICINTIGSYLCVCKEGYTGSYSSCYDIDECKLDKHTCNAYPTLDTETSFINGEKKYFSSDPFSLDDGKYHSIRFDLQSYDTSVIGIGNSDEEVLFYINPSSVDVKYREGEAISTLNSITDIPSEGRIGKDFVPYQIGFKLLNGMINIDFGALGSNIGASITYSKFPTNFTGYSFQSLEDFAFWRNVRKNGPDTLEYCINTIGSFLCTDIDNFGIGFGGTTDSSYETSTDVSVISSAMFSCGAHLIPKLEYSVMGHGMATLNNHLLVCGGFEDGVISIYYASRNCYKFNLNNPSESWTGSTALPYVIGHHSMVSYGSSIYVFGGTDTDISRNDLLQFSQIGGGWVYRAKMFYNAHGVGGIADEDGGRLWTFGGYTNGYGLRSTVTYYTVGTNTWTYHGELRYATEYNACVIVWTMSNTKKIVCLLTGYSTIYSMSITSNYWYSEGSLYASGYYSFTAAKVIAFNHHQAAILSGYTTKFGKSLSNFFTFDYTLSSYKVLSNYKYLQNFGYHTAWTTIRSDKNYKATANCLASQTYAAIGWGGQFNTQWSVVLRQRNRYSSGNFETCHTRIIPDLNPGKKSPGIIVVNYLIIVCGGAEYLMDATEECYFLDTNDVNITKFEEIEINGWKTMESMPTARMSFSLEAYADVVFAIGGETSVDSAITSVDRWTQNTGWTTSTDLPKPLADTCSTSYEGKGKIFVGGGRGQIFVNKKLFVLDVKSETWSEHSSIGISEGSCGMSIVQHRVDGHMLLYVVGGDNSFYYDLTAEENSGSSFWRSVIAEYSSSYTRLVSLSMSEMLEVSYFHV